MRSLIGEGVACPEPSRCVRRKWEMSGTHPPRRPGVGAGGRSPKERRAWSRGAPPGSRQTNSGRPLKLRASSRAARRKRCTPTEKLAACSSAPSPGFYQGGDPGQSLAPSRRTSHRGDAELDEPLQIGDRRFWPGELDGDVHALPAARASAPALRHSRWNPPPYGWCGPAASARAATAFPMRPFPTIAIRIRLRDSRLATRDSSA